MSALLTPVAPGQSYVGKVAQLQVVVVKAVWGIFNNTNGSLFTSLYFTCCLQVMVL